MVLASNPLSLSVPDPAFESWLRDTGYLEVLDHRTSQLHRLSSSAPATSPSQSAPTPAAASSSVSLFSHVRTLLSLLTLNPFAKLTIRDFEGDTPSWTHGFVGSVGSYSYPASANQGRLRVHENLKRYARNYASLFVLFFACSLYAFKCERKPDHYRYPRARTLAFFSCLIGYQMPFALVGLLSSLALWEGFRFCGDRWNLDRRPFVQQILVRIAQCGTAIILFFSNVQMALFCALGVCYAFMILHASFRKLTPANKPARGRR